MSMLITYRRTGGGFTLLGLAAAVLTATVLAVAVGVTLLIVAVAIGAVALLARAVLPISWRRHVNPPARPWAHETIETTVVNPPGSADRLDLLRVDGRKG